jgi:hypothetical protein
MPASRSRRRWRRLALTAAVLALIGGAWWLGTTLLSDPRPAGPTVAGIAVCQPQVAVTFHNDGDLSQHEHELRQQPRVSAIALETQQQVLDWYRDVLVKAGPDTAPLGELLRVEAMPARAWLAAAPSDLDELRAEVNATVGMAAEAVAVTNPCTDLSRSSAATSRSQPAPPSR